MPQISISRSELLRGIRHEMEHTSNPQIARRIALDHLLERPDYYSRLSSCMTTSPSPEEKPSIGLWWGSGELWRCIRVKDMYGQSKWYGPLKMSKDAAVNWNLDMANQFWGSTVSVYTHENGSWRYGV